MCASRPVLAELLRVKTSKSGDDLVGLKDYVSNMKPDQNGIPRGSCFLKSKLGLTLHNVALTELSKRATLGSSGLRCYLVTRHARLSVLSKRNQHLLLGCCCGRSCSVCICLTAGRAWGRSSSMESSSSLPTIPQFKAAICLSAQQVLMVVSHEPQGFQLAPDTAGTGGGPSCVPQA